MKRRRKVAAIPECRRRSPPPPLSPRPPLIADPVVGAGTGQGDAGSAPPRRHRCRPSTPSLGSPTAARRRSNTGEAGSGRRDPSSAASPPSKTWPVRAGHSAPPPQSGAAAGRKALPPPSMRSARRPGRPLGRQQGEAVEREGALAGRSGSPLQSSWRGRPKSSIFT
jgi:hypothetical protein